MRQLFAVMALLCLFTNAACTDFENTVNEAQPDKSENPTKQDQGPINSSSLGDYLNISIEPTTELERYMVYFSWPELEDGKRVRIRKEQTLSVVPSTQTTFSHEVLHNQTLTYTFETLDSNSYVEDHFSKVVHIPRDLVITNSNSSFTENQKLNVNRLFLTQETPLRTNGYNIELVANQLFSQNGVIETFPENSKAGPSIDGKSGGSLTIKADIASGNLKIFMRGQHGGDGDNGAPYNDRAQDGGAPGAGKEYCECVGNCRVVHSGGLALFNATPSRNTVCKCTRVGANGTNANNGATGKTGGRAGHGGDSGNLKIEVKDGSGFFIETFASVGLAGTPGKGGPGQKGGIAPKPNLVCGGKPGADGSDGGKGENGAPGTDGEMNLRCIFIATEAKNDCF